MIGIKKKTPDIEKILIGDIELPVHIRKNARSKRISMRFNTTADSLVLTLPKRTSKRKGMKFLNSNINWIVSSLASLPKRKEFIDGAILPFIGNDYVIKHRPEAKRGVWIENDAINVSGQIEHLPRRVKDFIKKEAGKAIIPRVHAFAEQIGKPVNHISLRDTRSRWGSCSSNGRISFSWRLVFAPEHVL
ncbi:MAG: DUF45 domain-containing protein, partial [Alphaproteobacteria bacterium]|nr:DUF45 domain-containing protein [Alphaproteobacteria bacterium]